MMYDLSSVVERNIWGPFDALLKIKSSGKKSYEFLELLMDGDTVSDDWRDLVCLSEIFALFIQNKLYKEEYRCGTLSVVLSLHKSIPSLVIRTKRNDMIKFSKIDAGTFVQVSRKLLNYCMLF